MTGPGRPRVDPVVRFWQKVDQTPTCWIWTDYLNADGYGRLLVGERKVMAHRYSWELAGNAVPDGMMLDHTCHNRGCVNPMHLRVVTQYENMQNLLGAQSRNRTGVRGVTWSTAKRRYRVNVTRHHIHHFGGYFVALEEAAEAARQLRLSLFTHNDVDRRSA